MRQVARGLAAGMPMLALVLAFASCGGDGSPADDPGTGTEDVPTAEVVPDAAAETVADLPREEAPDAFAEVPGDANPSEVAPDAAEDPGTADDAVAPDAGADATADALQDLLPDAGEDTGPADVALEAAAEVPADLPAEASEKPAVAVNEVVAAPPTPLADWVELYNHGTMDADLSGWTLKDNDDTHVFTFPAGTVLKHGEYLVIEGQGGIAPLTATFGFGKSDAVRLYDEAGAPVDQTSWVSGQAPLDSSWGRYPDGTGPFATLTPVTRGAPNSSP